MSTVEHWQTYWQAQTTPMHRADTEEFYARHAAEIRVALGPGSPQSVLEIGCGTGALYTHLDFDKTRYRGVDFSPAMLEVFSRAWPGVEVVCAEGSAYRDDGCYDLIFSNGVVQYFDPSMLDQHLANARAMLAPDGVFLCGSILCKPHRLAHAAGALTPPYRGRLLPLAKGFVRRLLPGRDALGYWYGPGDVAALASRHGMSVQFFGSMCYLYRFHAVMKPNPGPREA